LSPDEQAERAHIHALLEANHWNKAAVARALGLSKPTLFKRLHKYGFMGSTQA
jgi:transcriptional regulator of acetoin/glycerol metabolism